MNQLKRRRTLITGAAVAIGSVATGCTTLGPSGQTPATQTSRAIGPIASSPNNAPVGLPSGPQRADLPPIIFVHGNGDTAALWITTMWRFETNGWPRNRLFAIDMRLPLARSDDGVAQPGRSSSVDQLNELNAEVDRVRRLTGAPKVILIGNSRGGFAIRNYIRNGAGRQTVLAAILGGTPNHGVWRSATFAPQSEFNGMGRFLTALNSPQGPDGSEVTPGVFFATIRSDNNDKFTQPDGRWIGQPGTPTGVSFDGPALKGATNIVLPGIDHRETSFHPEAFAASYKFLTGNAPNRTDIAREDRPVLNGKIAGLHEGSTGELSNLPLVGARLTVFETNAATGERRGTAVHSKTVGADGLWGPFAAKPTATYEFVIEATGFAITHIYRSPFLRSSDIVNMRPVKMLDADRDGHAVVTMTRPRGYFGIGRDKMNLDGKPPTGLAPGTAGLSTAKVKSMVPGIRSLVAEFNNEKIAVQTWSLRENRVVFAEFHD